MTSSSPPFFIQHILEQFMEAVRHLLHPSLYERTLRQIGVSLGRDAAVRSRLPHAMPRPATKEDFIRCGKWIEAHLGMNHDIRIEADNRIAIRIPQCPFGGHVVHDPAICQVEAGMFGSVAGDLFGYGKVVVHRDTGSPPKDCRMTIYLERTPQALATEGTSYPVSPGAELPERDAPSDRRALANLSQRELQVVKLIGEGLSDKEIAEALRLSVRTVEGHMARIREKTGLGSRSALIRLALRSNSR